MKPYYQDDFATIYCGDCREVLPQIESGTVDMIWTDPPYGHSNQDGDLQSSRIGVKGGRQREAVAIKNDNPDEMRLVVSHMLCEAVRVLKSDCCCCCCCGGGGPSPTFAWIAERMDQQGLQFFHSVIWDKSARGNGLGWRYRRNYEMVMVAHRRSGKLLWSNDDLAVPNITRIAPEPNDFHPTTKPVGLAHWFIQNHSKEDSLILDPFMGSGTTLRAAKDLGRKSIGIELEERYCEIAVKRLAQEVFAL